MSVDVKEVYNKPHEWLMKRMRDGDAECAAELERRGLEFMRFYRDASRKFSAMSVYTPKFFLRNGTTLPTIVQKIERSTSPVGSAAQLGFMIAKCTSWHVNSRHLHNLAIHEVFGLPSEAQGSAYWACAELNALSRSHDRVTAAKAMRELESRKMAGFAALSVVYKEIPHPGLTQDDAEKTLVDVIAPYANGEEHAHKVRTAFFTELLRRRRAIEMLADHFGVENIEIETRHLTMRELLGLDDMPCPYKPADETDDEETDDEEPPTKVQRV
jgi:hypothetical protein